MNLLSTFKSLTGLRNIAMTVTVVGLAANAISGLVDQEIQKRELKAKVNEAVKEALSEK